MPEGCCQLHEQPSLSGKIRTRFGANKSRQPNDQQFLHQSFLRGFKIIHFFLQSQGRFGRWLVMGFVQIQSFGENTTEVAVAFSRLG